MLEEFKNLVGIDQYESFIDLLKAIGPDSRTHRISVVIAAYLMYALNKTGDYYKADSLEEALVLFEETGNFDGEEFKKLYHLIDIICHESGMKNQRTDYKGNSYSIAQTTLEEYIRWYQMPWE